MHLQVPATGKSSAGKIHPELVKEGKARLELDLSPVAVAAGLRHCEALVFLDSATPQPGAISLVAAEPEAIWRGTSFAVLEREIARRQRTGEGLDHGAAIGWITYEGEMCFGFYDHVLVYDHSTHSWSGSEDLAGKIRRKVSPRASEPLVFTSSLTSETYCAQVARAQAYIAAGDIYQVNLTYSFLAEWDGDAFALFESLRQSSPSPFSAYLALGETEILSSSPELFLKMNGRKIITRPIKGTRPRTGLDSRDVVAAHDLLTSSKEIAELVMITDLERNDLGKICDYGQVGVTELIKLEEYQQIFHLTSTVEGTLRKEISHVAALESCFPGGSITGAPKKRAREIIQEIERRERGIYTGAFGYFGYNGESQFAIAIRTLSKMGRKVSFSVGAGIVADSIPEKEYQETRDKAAGILLAAKQLTSQTDEDGQPE